MNYRKFKKIYRKTRKNNNWSFSHKNSDIVIIKFHCTHDPITGAIIGIKKIYYSFSDIKKKLRKYSFMY